MEENNMRFISKAILCCGLILSLLLTGCGGSGDGGKDTTAPADTEPTDTPAVNPAKHEISVSEVESILAANELSSNARRYDTDACAYHGGHQMRVCHTERGTYAAFARDYGDGDEIQKFYVAKIDNDGKVTILYYGGFEADDGSITVNVCRDTNGDILVTATSTKILSVLVFDSETDEMTKYDADPVFSSDEAPGYGQVMFDLQARKIYLFTAAGSWSSEIGDFLLEWFVFDLESMKWTESSTYVWLEDIGRHCYMYPLPDGNGGAYMVAVRDEKVAYVADRLTDAGNNSYVWDRLNLFHIPDLTTGENITYTTVQFEDDSRGHEGIWSGASGNQYGDVFIDSNGYMHITYRFFLADYAGTHADFDSNSQYKHAVYKGEECIYNEKIDIPSDSYKKCIVRQSTDGKLHLIVANLGGPDVKLEIYTSEDDIGRTWKHEKSINVGEKINVDSFSASAVRDGSVQDNVISCFFYGVSTEKVSFRSGYTFNLSLEDYSVTELVDILADCETKVDDVGYDKRIPYADHTTQIVRTENGIYAAFVYSYDHRDSLESFVIAKIDKDNKVSILFSDSYESSQEKYMTISADENGMVYVCPPFGREVYLIDPATDEVTFHEMTPLMTSKLLPSQLSILPASDGNKYYLSVLEEGTFKIASETLDPEKLTIAFRDIITYESDPELVGRYDSIYALSDGKSGAYLVGTRIVTEEDLDGKLVYDSYVSEISDSVVMAYIPNLVEGEEISYTAIHTPYEDEGDKGIWSNVDVKDVFLSSDGKLNVIYTDCHYDYNSNAIFTRDELIKDTLKYYLAVYDGNELVSKEEISIDGLNETSAVKMAETADGTVYLLCSNLVVCDLKGGYPEGADAEISVYFETDDGWKSVLTKELGEFAAEGFYVDRTAGSDTVNCLVYASNRDVYCVTVDFTAKS